MATKTADKKKTAPSKPVAVQTAKPGAQAILATEYLVARIHRFLVSYGEPARLGDIAVGLADDGATANLVRYTLGQHPARFVPVDRRWDVRTRYLDPQRPMTRLLEEVVSTFDAPIAAWEAAHEISTITNRSAEAVRPIVERLLKSSGAYAPMDQSGSDVKYGLRSWLLNTKDHDGDGDMLFYNFLPPDAAAPYERVVADWASDPVEAAVACIAATSGSPKVVDSRLLLYLAWRSLQEDYDGDEIFSALYASDRIVLLPTHRLTDQSGLSAIRTELARMAEEAETLPEEEEPITEDATPLSISAADLDEMMRIVSGTETAVSAAGLVQEVYDTTPGERTYSADVQAVLIALMANSARFQWVGYDRFRAVNSLPPYIGQVPESLQFPVVPQIPDADEDLLDQILADEGFERGLDRDIRNPVAMDVGDEDPPETAVWPAGESADSRSLRLVLKAHHKEIGTFPLCQIPAGFLPDQPAVLELTLRDSRGAEYQVFADQGTRLIYGIGLFDLYSGIAIDSGAIFGLERTGIPGEFRFTSSDEVDPDFAIAPERMEQLHAYRAEIEAGPATSTHDVVRYILEHSNQSMTYLNLLAEVNVVRRTTRRQLASILSGWSAFAQKSGLWSYDVKKSAAGFNKNKRKYIA